MTDRDRTIHVAAVLGVPPPQRVDDARLKKMIDRMMTVNTDRVEMPVANYLDVLTDLHDLRAAYGQPSEPHDRLDWHLDNIRNEFWRLQQDGDS